MAKVCKRMRAAQEKVEKGRLYSLKEAVELVQETAMAKFDESIEIHVRLNVDPRHADQQVRSTIVLPHGTGIEKKVLVLAMGEKVREAEEAGADFVGGEDMVTKISGGWLEFDAVIATPDMMKSVGRLGRFLGPRGLMPSAKAGTVTFDIADAVREIKAGRIEFRVDKFGIIHNGVGKKSFSSEQLYENIKTIYQAIVRARPASVKGTYVRSFSIASSMGPGIKIDPAGAQREIADD
ncbi:MAG: 50S ribosomal protein L1 [Synergistaceae bacterium]|jgi:large subunit ribosomal protein L1|nr:50S ribosomal protein L1 [Synergistaceae bacterium]